MSDCARIKQLRRTYAENVCFVANVTHPGVLEAFANVPKELFLGDGPWRVLDRFGYFDRQVYFSTADASPEHLYHDTLVAIDESRGINSGGPSFHAFVNRVIKLNPNESVVHIGCGVGYYSAIYAELVGTAGKVTAIEIEDVLAVRAKQNLSRWSNTIVLSQDGSIYDPAPFDCMFINAAIVRLRRSWIDALKPGGRIFFPLGAKDSGSQLLMITRVDDQYLVSNHGGERIYNCQGNFREEDHHAVKAALSGDGWRFSGVVRLDPHPKEATCWLHFPDYCFSTKQRSK